MVEGRRKDWRMQVDDRGVRLGRGPKRDHVITLDDDPVFAAARFTDRTGFTRWPIGVRVRLADLSATRIGAVDLSGRVLDRTEHDFGGHDHWQPPTDQSGRPLRLNKWGWFGVELRDRTPGEKTRALSDTKRLLEVLDEHGLPGWIVGGTLLGAVRAHDFIEHDDDIDLAYLSSHHTPSLVVSESFELERAISRRGWRCRRFSGAHFQITGAPVDDQPPIHIDMFSAFLRRGRVHQPFHIRGRFEASQILPLTTVELQGTNFPAPRDTNGWLRLNYGPDWAVPVPGHTFKTPRTTQILFSSWFGQYLRHFEYWSDYYARRSGSDGVPSESALWLSHSLPPGIPIIDLGTGHATDARFLGERGFPVLGVDYISVPPGPIDLPRSGIGLAQLDVSDSRSLLRLVAAAHRVEGPVHVHSRNLVDEMDPLPRRSLFALLRKFPAGSTFSMTVRLSRRASGSDDADPTRRTLDLRTISHDSWRSGLDRVPVLKESATPHSNVLFRGERGGGPRDRALTRRLQALPRSPQELKTEIAEWRRLPLRTAEVEDLDVAHRSDGS